MSPSNKKKQGKSKATTSSTTSSSSKSNNDTTSTPPHNTTTPPIDETHNSVLAFIQHADLQAIKTFLETAASTPQGANLQALWSRAFREGGRIYKQLYVETVQKANEAQQTTYDEGRRDEENEWILEGHSSWCHCVRQFQESTTQTEPPIHVDISTSTDAVTIHEPLGTHLPQPNHPTASISIQTQPTIPESPPQIHLDLQTHSGNKSLPTPSKHLDWADDASALPITSKTPRLLPLPPPSLLRPPRDLSSLYASTRKPFASLQRRHRQQQQPRHHRLYHKKDHFSCSHQPFLHRHLSQNPTCHFQPRPANPDISRFSASSSTLNWENDPRLSDLSQALKALGWVRPESATRTPPR